MNGGNYVRNKKDFLFLVIGVKIAYYRTLRLTQAELAKRVNLSKDSIKYNKGIPISTLLDIAEGLPKTRRESPLLQLWG